MRFRLPRWWLVLGGIYLLGGNAGGVQRGFVKRHWWGSAKRQGHADGGLVERDEEREAKSPGRRICWFVDGRVWKCVERLRRQRRSRNLGGLGSFLVTRMLSMQ